MNTEIVHFGKHYHPEVGGIETATRNAAETAARLGLRVTCFSSSPRAALPRRYWVGGVVVRRQLTLGKFLSAPLTPGSLRPRRYQRAVIHVHLPNPFAELSALLHIWRNGGRCRLMPFFHAFPLRQGRLGRYWYHWVTRRLLDRAERILVSSPHVAHAFPELAPYAGKIEVLPFVTSSLSAEAVRALWARERDGKTVFALGRLVPYKGMLDLLAAWRQFSAAHPGFRLALVGDGPLRERVAEMAGELRDSVTWLPDCTDEEKRAWFARASLFVLPSRDASETFGIAAMEAMSQGLPLLTTTVPTGLSALARGGLCGAVVAPGDVGRMAEALRELLVDRAPALPALGEGNRDFVARHFSPDALDERYRNLIGLDRS